MKIPVSKAKNAYDLLTEIRRLILAEPKRYNQEHWLSRGVDDLAVRGLKTPNCGTVGCVAGWVVALKHPEQVHYNQVMYLASQILGLTIEQRSVLFSGGACYKSNVNPQTRVHARLGAKHIKRFQDKHEAQLKATLV